MQFDFFADGAFILAQCYGNGCFRGTVGNTLLIIWRSVKVRWRTLLQVIEFSSFRVKQQEVCIHLYYFIMKE